MTRFQYSIVSDQSPRTGKCKEKEVAKAEYRAAVAAGHGAYLMEKEEEEDVFTVSVGNLPPKCNCIIQVRAVSS